MKTVLLSLLSLLFLSVFTRSHVDLLGSGTDTSLAGKRVGVVRLNIGEVLVSDLPDATPISFGHVEDALFSLLSGNIDALIYPEPVLWQLARGARIDDRIEVMGQPLTEILRAISVSNDNPDLLAVINPAVDQLIGSAQYRQIYTRWYGTPKPFWTVRRTALFLTAAIAFVFFLMLFWRYRSTIRLNRELKKSIEQKEAAEKQLQQAHDTLEERVEERTRDLQKALSEVKTLSGLLPICSHCKKIRDDKGYWNQIESYIQKHSSAEFSHSICRECAEKLYPDLPLYKD